MLLYPDPALQHYEKPVEIFSLSGCSGSDGDIYGLRRLDWTYDGEVLTLKAATGYLSDTGKFPTRDIKARYPARNAQGDRLQATLEIPRLATPWTLHEVKSGYKYGALFYYVTTVYTKHGSMASGGGAEMYVEALNSEGEAPGFFRDLLWSF